MTHEECQAKLREAEDALHQLNLGMSVVEVWHENGRMRYNAASKKDLAAYVLELQGKCGSCGPSRSAIGVRF